MSDKVSPTIEDYLGVIYVLERDKEPIVGVRLAELLGVTPPTVTNTLKRMVRDGLLEMEAETGTHLTAEGLDVAKTVMRRHMLAEWMLSRMLSWSKLHKEAHSIEHAISPDVETALIEELNQPELCPHGNPLPGYEDVAENWVALTALAPGTRVIIRRIHELAEEIPDVLAFLEGKNVSPGVEACVTEVLSFNQTLTLQVGANQVTLGFPLARYIFVEPLANETEASAAA